MARDNRTLQVDISGDPKGFDKAAKQAQAAASAFDKELAKLERTERKQQAQTERNAAATRRLEKAQKEAADAVGRLERGEIDAAEAARLQERAENQLNKVLAAQAAASRAAAQAAEELAEEQRAAARAAETAAVKQRLATLKASGSVREHNSLVRQLRTRFPELAADASGAFTEIATTSSKASAQLAKAGPAGIAAIAVAIAALPTLATAAGGAITLGLGGAIAGIGIAAAAQSARVKRAFEELSTDVTDQLKTIAKPFEDTLLRTAVVARRVFSSFAPLLADAFADLAPTVTRFVEQLGVALLELRPMIGSITHAFNPLLDSLGAQLPTIFRNLAGAITPITDAVADNADEFTALVVALSGVVRMAGDLTGAFIRLYPAVAPISPLLKAVIGSSGDAAEAQRSAALAAGSMAQETGRLGTTLQIASQTANQLKASLDQLSGKTLTLREATANYQAAIDNATASIKENGKAHGFNTEKSRANEAALDQLAVTAQKQAVAMRDSGKGAIEVARFMETARQRFIATAIGMGKTRAEAVALATKLFGVRNAANSIPKSKTTSVQVLNTRQTIALIERLRRLYGELPRQVVTDIITRHIESGSARTGYGRQHHAEGGYVGYADGGWVRGYPAGGPVSGPGTATSDSIPAMLSNGEFVINAKSTKEFRPLLEAMNSRRLMPKSMTYGPAMSHRPATSGSSGGGASGSIHLSLNIGGRNLGEVVIDPLRKTVKSLGGVEAAFA